MAYSRFDRPTAQRKALLRGLVTSLLEKERIETTLVKAKEAQSLCDKMISLAKEDSLAARRRALAFLTKEDVVKKLFDTIGPRYAHRQGGYTRVIETRVRRGDGAPMAIVELIRPEK
ncbi:MAG: 50S ribosomal protein L17 [Candidatus Fermentithermobacillus carboniphilus]|uniref:Large ribosomal subunit protein bL17 n=1 Tax=Candidatus Fermentithermobacillus carboniphilus TaxID=3085328 RepID=A0AAT9LF31_9FIRM|nr:MAG: 50S ribosomal protein L17 [Candidatus Fermentithermobacillus carboniphilus]